MRKIKISETYKKGENCVAVSSVSPFYPDGKGGQLGDRGKIGEANVLKVWEEKEKVYHLLDRCIEKGEYQVEIDEFRRKDISEQHTAQHILSAAFIHIANIETVSFHMGEEASTIDLNVPYLTPEVLIESENLANKIVKSLIKVEEIITTKEESYKYKLRKPLSDKVKGPVRLIKIGDFDISACAGFHVKNTGEIGIIKIVDKEKVKGKLTRVYFLAGNRALKDYRKRVNILKSITTKLTTSVDEIEVRIENLLKNIKEQASLIEKLSEEMAKTLSEKLSKIETKAIPVVYYEGYESVAKYLPKYVNLNECLLITFDGNKFSFSSQSFNCKDLVEKIKSKFEGKGGAGKTRGTFMGKLKIEDIINILNE